MATRKNERIREVDREIEVIAETHNVLIDAPVALVPDARQVTFPVSNEDLDPSKERPDPSVAEEH